MYKTIITGVTGDFYKVHQVVAAHVEGHHTWRQDGPTVTILSSERPQGRLLEGTTLGAFKQVDLRENEEFPILLRVCAAMHTGKNEYKQITENKIGFWLRDQLTGFGIQDLACAGEPASIGVKAEHRITVSSYQVSAVVRVIDAELANQVLAAGIGRARRFGFGAILVCR